MTQTKQKKKKKKKTTTTTTIHDLFLYLKNLHALKNQIYI